jgi:hypothetical protein
LLRTEMQRKSAGVRYQASPFVYNGRVAAALVPSLFVLGGFGGRVALGILMVWLWPLVVGAPSPCRGACRSSHRIGPTAQISSHSSTGFGFLNSIESFLDVWSRFSQVGAMVAYIMDALRYKEGAFGAIWLMLGSANLSLLLTAAAFKPGWSAFLIILVILLNSATLLLLGPSSALCPAPPDPPLGHAAYERSG